MKKKLLSILVATTLLLTCIPFGVISVSAATSGDWEYTVANGEATITEYTGPGGAITIPSTLGGYSVTGIENYAFDDTYTDTDSDHTAYEFDEDALTLIAYIEDGYGDFGESDYWFGTRNDKTYTTVGPVATRYNGFYCQLYEMSDISEYTVVTEPETGKAYKFGMIQGNVSNTTVYYLNGAMNGYYMDTTTNWNAAIDVYLEDSDSGDYHLYTKNTDGAKQYINMVVSGTHVNGVYELDNTLISITIPNSVTYIGDDAFSYCNSLTTINVSENNTSYSSANGVLFNKDKTVLIKYPVGKSGAYIIPDSVTTIGDWAFNNCDSLTSVTINENVTSIEDYAFDYCNNLTDVYYGGSLGDKTNITFGYNNESLLNATWHYAKTDEPGVPTNLIYEIINGEITITGYIGEFLAGLIIPNTIKGYPITTIGESAFDNCDSLTSVSIPDSVITIGYGAFSDCDSLTSVSIPNSITTISDNAFFSCASLSSVNIPDSVTTIGDSAFDNCDSLTAISIPDSVTTIGCWAFSDCDSLTSVTIGENVTAIGENAFTSCNNLTAFEVSKNNVKYCSVDGVLFNKNKSELIQYPSIRSGAYTIPDSVTAIGYSAFNDCRFLTSVDIPNSVTSIGDKAFSWCNSLTLVNIPDSITSIGDGVFSWCNSLTSVTIGNGVTAIADNAFYECRALTSVTIGNQVTTIGEAAFSHCAALKSVNIPNSVTTIGDSAFDNCYSLSLVTIPNSVTAIEYHAFFACKSLKSVIIPGGVTIIGEAAFSSCDALTLVIISDGVTTIMDRAFSVCNTLTSVTIPDSVTSIGYETFRNCDSLTDVYYGGSENDKANITINSTNGSLLNATWHYADDPISDDVAHSVMDTANGNGLAFRFELTATGVEKNNRNVIDLSNATINYLGAECKLIGMGTVVTNNDTAADNLTLAAVNDFNVINVPTVYLQEADEDSCAFATRIIDIPDTSLERVIYARPYFIVEVDGEQITVYGDVHSATCAEYL